MLLPFKPALADAFLHLFKLLLSIHNQTIIEERRYTGIPVIDNLIAQVYKPSESSSQRLPLIEVAGVGPCSGKTQLLYRIAAELLLNHRIEGASQHDDLTSAEEPARVDAAEETDRVRPGGIVIWIDCEQSFDPQRFDTISKTTIANSARIPDGYERDLDTLRQCLLIYQPSSFSALLSTVASLPEVLLGDLAIQNNSTPATQRHVAAMIISSADSFLPFERAAARNVAEDVPFRWDLDRQIAEVTMQHEGSQTPYMRLNARYARLAASLRRVQDLLGGLVIAGRRGGNLPGLALPGSWAGQTDVRVRVERRDLRRSLGRGISVLEALETRDLQLQLMQDDLETALPQDGTRDSAGQSITSRSATHFHGLVAGAGQNHEQTQVRGVFGMCVDSLGVWLDGEHELVT